MKGCWGINSLARPFSNCVLLKELWHAELRLQAVSRPSERRATQAPKRETGRLQENDMNGPCDRRFVIHQEYNDTGERGVKDGQAMVSAGLGYTGKSTVPG